MTAPDQQPHPWRCETCRDYEERPHPVYEGHILCYCGDERTQSETKVITARVGCASHHLARQNNPASIIQRTREEVLEILTSACSIRAFVDSDGDVHYGALTLEEIQDVLRSQSPTTGSTTSPAKGKEGE